MVKRLSTDEQGPNKNATPKEINVPTALRRRIENEVRLKARDTILRKRNGGHGPKRGDKQWNRVDDAPACLTSISPAALSPDADDIDEELILERGQRYGWVGLDSGHSVPLVSCRDRSIFQFSWFYLTLM
jgi:hypothetical protein